MITLITGATSGIGEQLAIKYAEQGDTVIACGRNTQKLAELAKHNNIETCQFDATNLQDIKLPLSATRNLTALFLTPVIASMLMMHAILIAPSLSVLLMLTYFLWGIA